MSSQPSDFLAEVMKALSGLSDEHRKALADLIEAERDHYISAWTFLNEMRCRGELPSWAFKSGTGSHAAHEEHRTAARAVNMALFGVKDLCREAVAVAHDIEG